jgi:hypothetical protein
MFHVFYFTGFENAMTSAAQKLNKTQAVEFLSAA